MDSPPPRRITTAAGIRLSTIMEDGKAPPRTPPSRSGITKKLFFPEHPLRRSYEKRASVYEAAAWSDATSSSLESQKEKEKKGLAENKHIARRGGWKRLALIILALLLLALALGLGLGLGLSHKKKPTPSSTSTTPPSAAFSSSPSPPNPSSTGVSPNSPSFPLGSYSLPTFLDTIQTNCTSNPSTWTCFPYTTYNDSPTKSLATFNWEIASSSPGNYTITSSNDPFAITFASQPLTLLDKGADSERYTFQLSMTKQVSPSAPITDNGAASTCFYNATTFQAYLYTKMGKDYPEQGNMGESGGGEEGSKSFTPWPFAVRVEQVAGGGQDVPNCYETKNGVVGERVTEGLEKQADGELCSCLYKNYITPS